MNNIAYDGRNYRRAQMMKRLSDEYFDTSTKYEDIKRAADQAVDVKEDGASPNKSTSIKINEGSESEKTVSIITIGHEGYFPTQAELNIHRDALESLGVRDFILTPYPIDIKKMKIPLTHQEKEDTKRYALYEGVQDNLYQCRQLLFDTEQELGCVEYQISENELIASKEAVEDKIKAIDKLLLNSLKPIEDMENRAIQKWFDQSGEGHMSAAPSQLPQADIAGALFDFAGYLTTLEVPMTVGSAHNANTILDHLTAWSKERGLNLEDANVEKWNKTGSKPEERNPSKSETVSQLVDVARESFRYYTSKPAGMPGIRVKEIKDEEGIKSEATTKIKNEVIEIMRESLKNLVGSPTGTKADADVHVSVDVYPTVPLEYIDVTVELEENVNVF